MPQDWGLLGPRSFLVLMWTVTCALVANQSQALDSCDPVTSFPITESDVVIPDFFISPVSHTKIDIYVYRFGAPIGGADVNVVLPPCFTSNLPGAIFCGNRDQAGSEFVFHATTSVGGKAEIIWDRFDGAGAPGGGCLPWTSPEIGSCATRCGSLMPYVQISYVYSGSTYCGKFARSIVSPDVVSFTGRRFCDSPPWGHPGQSWQWVALNDAVEFTTNLSTSAFDKCADMNNDETIGLPDAVILTVFYASGPGCYALTGGI
jgi:hypothetical protein